jgi:uncharacterized protein YciI
MEKVMYMMLIEKTKTYNRLTKKAVTEHVENIRKLDDAGKLEICGVFRGYPGMAGMYILKTESREEAEALMRVAGLGLEGTPETGADVMDLELERSMELRKDIRQFVNDNPEIAAQMIKTWLKGGEGNG